MRVTCNIIKNIILISELEILIRFIVVFCKYIYCQVVIFH